MNLTQLVEACFGEDEIMKQGKVFEIPNTGIYFVQQMRDQEPDDGRLSRPVLRATGG